MRGSEDERERSGMVDARAETSSLSDKTEFTETKDQGATHQYFYWQLHRVTDHRTQLRAELLVTNKNM
jgi:hypothetical protein